MKKILIAFVAVLCLVSCGNTAKDTKVETKEDVSKEAVVENVETIEIAVEGMTCSGCENSLKSKVGKIEGVAEVQASHTDSCAVVKFDPTKTDVDAIKDIIQKTGYTAGDHKNL